MIQIPVVLEEQKPNSYSQKKKHQEQKYETPEVSKQKVAWKETEQNASESDPPATWIRCNCKKSKCLKLYCDCFAAGLACDELCNCCGCDNH